MLYLQLPLLHSLLHSRLKNFFSQAEEGEDTLEAYPTSSYSISNLALNHNEYYTLLLALAPHLQPSLLDTAVQEFLPNGGEFPEFGGVKSGNHRGMMPTGETALFLLAGNDMEQRIEVQQLFSQDHFFYKQKILWLEDVKEGEPRMSGRLILSQEWLEQLLYGKAKRPQFGPNFPAKLIETKMGWEDVVLNPNTRQQLDVIASWMAHNNELMADVNLSRKLKPGYRVLFYGPPGTGKTLTASLIGKQFGKDVYRIDLSQITSKYIGETEKNLEKIFSKADNHDWILFFDEADALFGKRTGVQSSNDRYANQEVSYLLQRVEDFPGLMILASNIKNNIDTAFLRRFQQVIHFPSPDAGERLALWKKALPLGIQLHPEIDLNMIAQKYDMTGASIVNVIQFASLQALRRTDKTIQLQDLITGIHREFQKEERSVGR